MSILFLTLHLLSGTLKGLGHNVEAIHHDGAVGGRTGDFDVVREEGDKAASAARPLQ